MCPAAGLFGFVFFGESSFLGSRTQILGFVWKNSCQSSVVPGAGSGSPLRCDSCPWSVLPAGRSCELARRAGRPFIQATRYKTSRAYGGRGAGERSRDVAEGPRRVGAGSATKGGMRGIADFGLRGHRSYLGHWGMSCGVNPSTEGAGLVSSVRPGQVATTEWWLGLG